jgi:hypothetical protein
MIITLIGFYPTYISKFPSFTNITTIHHFHGAMMMTWFLLLIIQPFLISYNKYTIHRTLGKLSYVIAPLVLFSIFLAARGEYYRDTQYQTENEGLAGLALDLTNIVAFAICYLLAILNRHNTPYHMRYMICTAILMLGPGMMRVIAVYKIFGDIDFPTNVLYTYAISIGISLGLIIYDLIKRNPYKPYLVVIALMAGIYITYLYRMSDAWLGIAKKIAELTF